MSRLVILICSLCAFAACDKKGQGNGEESGFNPSKQDTLYLLNGKDLSDFEGVKDNWYLEDGMLIGSTMDGILEESSWITTKETFENFDLSMQVKLLGDENRNSGVYYRGEWEEEFVVGYEFDIGGWGEDDNKVWWGELHDPFRRDLWVGPSQEEIRAIYKPEEWNDIRIRVNGDRIQHWLNGVETVDWREKDQEISRSGFVAFQMHGETAFQVFFRDVTLIQFYED